MLRDPISPPSPKKSRLEQTYDDFEVIDPESKAQACEEEDLENTKGPSPRSSDTRRSVSGSSYKMPTSIDPFSSAANLHLPLNSL